VVEDAVSEAATLTRIRELGVGLHVDDFGTGYSSLATLHQMPIGALKIDRSFVATVHQRQDSLELVRAIVSLARNLRLEVIAEGVESEDQLAIVRGLGCDYAQGFLFSRPLRREDLERVLERDPLW
jgi:EAL domain-containing protein (putative c-di-GMP-specific phosphodiesterase class I)